MKNKGRIVTVVLKIEGDADWIWASHGKRDIVNGITVISISNGDLTDVIDDLEDDIYNLTERGKE